MNLKTSSAKLMSIILTIVMLVGMMPATMAMAEDPIYSVEIEDIELCLRADYTKNDVYALNGAGYNRLIKIRNTGNKGVIVVTPTLTEKSADFDDNKIWVNWTSVPIEITAGNTIENYYIDIDTGLAPGVYTATINFAGKKNDSDEVGSVTTTAQFKLTVGDHNWATDWTSDGKEHWHACNDSGCTARKDVAAHNSDKVGTDAKEPTFDTDGSTGTKYCSVCETKMAEAQTIAADKYISGSRATMTPAAITDAMCANDLTFTSAESDKYTVALYEGRVYDLTDDEQNTYNPGGSGKRYPSDKNFIAGHQYQIEFEFTPVDPYVYDGKGNSSYWTIFTLNGESTNLSNATTIGNSPLRSITLIATASGGATTHAHAWAEAWSKDSTHHWHNCTADGCDVTANSGKDGYATHTYDKEVATADYLATPATCQAKATYYKSCVCGAKGTATFESGEKAAHDFSGAYYKDADGHGKYCVTPGCTEHATVTSHVYDNDADTACNTCGYVRTSTPTTSYTITFDANEGTVSPATATTGADGKLATLPEPTRSNYKFVGWFTAKSGGEKVTISTVFTKDTTIYAQWKLKSTGGGGGSIVYKTLTFETNGGSYLDSITRNQGATVSLKEYKPTKSDYVFAGWYSDKKLTKKITTVSLDQDTTVYAAWQKNTPAEPVQTEPFVDVDVNDWFYDDVVYAYNNGLMGGMSANIFNPNVPTTRGMIVTILYRMENEPAINGIMPFNDVKAGSYYEKAILWAVGNNIVSGYGNGMFGPDDVITREQMASILWRYAQYKGYDVSIGEDTNILSYDDALSISAYAMPALQWACGDGIIGGTTANTLSPQGQATRAQTAAILHRFCDKIGR